MLSPKPEAVAKYQSLCPGYKQFAVVDEYELSNFPGWDVLKIFTTKEQLVETQQGISIDAYTFNPIDATAAGDTDAYGYSNVPTEERKVRWIEVRRYLIGHKETDVIDKLSKELGEKLKRIRDLEMEKIEINDKLRRLTNEHEDYRVNNRALIGEYSRTITMRNEEIAILEERIRKLEEENKNHGIVYGKTEVIQPAIRHIDLDDD